MNEGFYSYLTKKIKSISPQTMVLAGKKGISLFPYYMDKTPDIDIVIIGEGERILLQAPHCLIEDGKLNACPGIYYNENVNII